MSRPNDITPRFKGDVTNEEAICYLDSLSKELPVQTVAAMNGVSVGRISRAIQFLTKAEGVWMEGNKERLLDAIIEGDGWFSSEPALKVLKESPAKGIKSRAAYLVLGEAGKARGYNWQKSVEAMRLINEQDDN